MATKDIAVNGQVFPCPLSWTVEQARNEIRSRYVLQGGGIVEDGVPVLGGAQIRDLAGPLTFVGGRPIQQLVGELMAAGRARLVTVFGPQHTHFPPRGVLFDEDFITASELSNRLTELREQHGAFVDTFARALSKTKDFEKPMLGEDNKCTLCDRIDLFGYQCITCSQWVCEFCFPQVMRAEVRTTLVVLPNGVNEIHLKCPYCRNSFNEAIGPSPRNSNA